MHRTVWLAALVCAGGATPGVLRAQGPAKTDPASLDRLIEQLGDADYRKRDDAALRLRGEGIKALAPLRSALGHPDAEVRRRVRDLVPALETAAVLAPRRVTLKLNHRPLREALDAIEKQTGYKIESWGPANRTSYSFDFTDLPFWDALDTVCRPSGMVLQQGYGDDRIRLQAQEGYVPYVQYDGPFRIVPTGFQHYRNIEFGLVGKGGAGGARTETLTLGLTVFAEPKLPLLGMGEVRVDAAYDTERNSMLAPDGGPDEMADPRLARLGGRWVSNYGVGNRAASMPAQLALARPSDKATGVKVIRGRIPVTLLAEQTPVVVAEDVLKAKGTRAKVDTTSFHIEDVSQLANKQVQVKMTVSESAENPQDFTWMNALYQRIELQDEKGNKFMVVGNGWGHSTPGAVQITTTFMPQGARFGTPRKLIYYRWTTLQHEVAFEFKDLPLP